MEKLNRAGRPFPFKPEKILQFGEGNFLRCFFDWQVDILNEKCGFDGGIVVVRPIDSDYPPSLNTQDGLYTTILRGFDEKGALRDERRIISSVNRELSAYKDWDEVLETAHNRSMRFIVSNTTEAGISFNGEDKLSDAPPSSFPAKLTRYLYERYIATGGDREGGFIILPCELIDSNGERLKELVLRYCDLWNLEETCRKWIEESNIFCSTLVDRIVTGYPGPDAKRIEEELGYEDSFITAGEYFHLFAIQAPPMVAEELKTKDSGLDIKVVDDLKPYKVRKVGILNGCHTAMVPVAWLCGLNNVKEAIEDSDISPFVGQLLEKEIIPHLGLPRDQSQEFAESVINRFRNPYIKHRLLSISLNSMTKFRTRILPQFLDYYKSRGEFPGMMCFSLAALIRFYRGMRIIGGTEEPYDIKDDDKFLILFRELWAGDLQSEKEAAVLAEKILSLHEHWGTDLAELPGLTASIGHILWRIETKGMRSALKELL